MKIQINSVHALENHEAIAREVEDEVQKKLGQLATHITRVEVHLSDENGEKGGEHDKRCVMEARLEGHSPLAVTHEAQTIGQAVEGAAGKLKSSLCHVLGRVHGL